jgi:hypothetical protein
MIKQEIRSSVLSGLKKYDAVAKYHPRIIDAKCEEVLHQMLGEVFRMSPHGLQRYTRGYGYSVPLAVLSEATTGIYYTTLPEDILVFSDKASGVRRINPPTQSGIKFYPMDQREWDLVLGGSYVNYVKNKIGYIVTSDRVEYYGMTGTVIISGVRMDLIIPFSKYGEDDVVLFPEHTTQDGSGFIDRIVARLINKPTVNLEDKNKDEENKQ